jgi:hypothetical protein
VTTSTTSTVDLPPSKEVADLIERLGGMGGLEALRELSRQVWWVQSAVLWHVGRARG